MDGGLIGTIARAVCGRGVRSLAQAACGQSVLRRSCEKGRDPLVEIGLAPRAHLVHEGARICVELVVGCSQRSCKDRGESVGSQIVVVTDHCFVWAKEPR